MTALKKMEPSSKIFVAGHRGLVGGAIVRKLKEAGHRDVLTRTRQELDLFDQHAVNAYFEKERPEFVFVAAARVGGIHANSTYQADFLYENLMIACNVIKAAHDFKATKLLFLGSSCIYPRLAQQPMQETALLTGPLEPTNEAYAIAKIAGLKLCEKFQKQYGDRMISAMPTNLYGTGDNFHPQNSHVIPGMMRRFHEAKIAGTPAVTIWGTGKPTREFLHVDDLADALYLLMQEYEAPETVNVGTGEEISIAELAGLMKKIVGYEGKLEFDSSKPDGTPRKVNDVTKLRSLGWKHKLGLEAGLKDTYRWALENKIFAVGA